VEALTTDFILINAHSGSCMFTTDA